MCGQTTENKKLTSSRVVNSRLALITCFFFVEIYVEKYNHENEFALKVLFPTSQYIQIHTHTKVCEYWIETKS